MIDKKIGLKLLLGFLLVGFSISAQIRGVVVDEKNNPIPYVNIWVENENIGTTSELNGEFSINTGNDKVLVFSALGFEITKTIISENERVVMQPATVVLNEIVISKRKDFKDIEVGDAKKSYMYKISGDTPWISAKLFKYKDEYSETPFIKNAIVFTSSENKNAKFKFRIFEVKKDGSPGDDLLTQDVIVTVKSGFRKNVVDLNKLNLILPTNGVFMAFEAMIVEENKYLTEYISKSGEKKTAVSYEPTLICNNTVTNVCYEFVKGQWFESTKIPSVKIKKTVDMIWIPAINLTLSN